MSVEELEIGPWVIEVDREATRALYDQVIDGAEECTCDHCQSWHASREAIYPGVVRQLLDRMGIDYRREAEVYEGDPRPESHSCDGWFHLVGRVVSGPTTAWTTIPQGAVGRPPDPTPITNDFGVYFSGSLGPMKPALQTAYELGVRLAQLDFHTTRHRIGIG